MLSCAVELCTKPKKLGVSKHKTNIAPSHYIGIKLDAKMYGNFEEFPLKFGLVL